MGIFGQIGVRWVKSTTQFDEDCRQASLQFDKFQPVFSGLRHRIALAPEDGVPVGSNNHAAKIAPDPAIKAPGLVVLYRYDDTGLYLIRLRALPF